MAWPPKVFFAFALLAASACTPLGAPGPISHGLPSAGMLVHGLPIPERGEGFVRARPGEETRYGVPHLVTALTRAAGAVARAFPDSAPLRVGDLSSPLGGAHERHASHRTGRDADLVFYVVRPDGTSVEGRGWLAFDRFGVAREAGSPDVYFYDDARNWTFVRTLVLDDDARVQWIFCSNGVRARLLRYAARHEPDPDAIFRASRVLHQPSRGAPHDDHFHVRVLCGAEQRALGCRDHGPRWPWLRDLDEEPYAARPRYDDRTILDALLGDDAMPSMDE